PRYWRPRDATTARMLAWTSVLTPDCRRGALLLRAVEAVARVAEPRHDEALLVQAPVDGGADDVHVRMLAVHLLDPRRCRDDADQRHRLRARLLHGGNRRAARVAGRQH